MTTAPLPRPPQAPAPRAPGSGMPSPSIDAVKILKKYALVLAGAAVLGAALGTGGFFVLRQVYPIFRPTVVFQVLPPTTDAGEQAIGTDEDEQTRFAQTQVANMMSDEIIQRVVTDARLAQDGGAWYRSFESGGKFQSGKAAEWLEDHLSARLIPNTDIVELSMGWRDAPATTNVLGFIKETYLYWLDDQTREQFTPQKSSLEDQIRGYEDAYRDKQLARDHILRTEEVDSLEQRYAADNYQLNQVLSTLHELQLGVQAAQTQLSVYERELNSAGGPTYSDELIAAVEADPLLQQTTAKRLDLETQRLAMQRRGIGPDHRAMLMVGSLIESTQSKLEEQRKGLLAMKFAAVIDMLKNQIATLTAQTTDLSNEQQRLVTKLIDLSKTMVKVEDLDLEIAQLLKLKSEAESKLENLQGIAKLQNTRRIVVVQSERVPDRPEFPNILYTIPAGVVLCLGLTGGVVFLREVLDQRVKGPGDVALIPRTRVLGFVPDASEDSATSADQVGRVLSKSPRGVLAESYRQLRAPLLKQMDLAGHKTLVVLAGMPGSGASTTVGNLAESAAASGKRVLLIDANFRRPTQHKNFGVGESPGLADVLAGDMSVAQAVVATEVRNLSLLAAGTPAKRVVERLAGRQFGETLAAAAADYDEVFIDVPPVIVSGDGMAVANACDASLLVVRAYAEKRGLVSRIRNELLETRAEFLGVVVNGVRAAAGGYLRGNIRASQQYADDEA